MSFFFRHNPTVEVNFSVQSTVEAIGEDVVLVSQDVWDALYFSGQSRKVVSIKPKHQYPTGSPSDHIGALTCWAIYDPTVSDVAIPPAWLVAYPAIFQPFQMNLDGLLKSVILSSAENVVLSEVFLTAKHEEAYLAVSNHGTEFENWFFDSAIIIRDGEHIFIPTSIFIRGSSKSSSHFGYTVKVALPYRQGIAQRGLTRLVVTSSDQSSEAPDKMGSEVDHESLEINESFLISSMLSPPELLARANEGAKLSEAVFFAQALQSAIDVDMDQFTVYICASNLRPLGVLNGDWVLVSPTDCSTTSRLVRIGAFDGAFNDPCRRSAMLSPTLLHNLCPRGRREIVVRVSPYGTRDPGAPTATSVTLARVASPFSIHRRYEPLFVDALHEYFGLSKRLVKDGDIIPLRINIDYLLGPHHTLSPGDFMGAVMDSSSDVLVYFIIQNLSYGAVTVETQGQGCVGCFVDARMTRITQAGVENVRVPDVHDYYQYCCPQVTLPAATGITHQIFRLSNAMSLDEARSLGVQSTIFVTGPRGAGKFSVALHIAHNLQMHLAEINCFSVLSDTATKTKASLQDQVEHAVSCSPCLIVLHHVDALSSLENYVDGEGGSLILQTLQQCVDDANKTQREQCMLLGIIEQGKTPESISLGNVIEIKVLSEEERFCLLYEQVNGQGRLLAQDISIATLAKQTAALAALDLVDLIKQTYLCAVKSSNIQQLVTYPVISAKHLDITLLKIRTIFSQSMGAPSIPTVFWEDVGGLDSVKDEILDTVQLPLDHPELFQNGLKKRSGVLLYGPPGTGKTLLAKAVATSCSLNFFSVKGPELLNMYIGESEANVRHVFQHARDAKPCVIFFDELDSIAPKRGNQGDSGGVMDRIVSQLLAELDGMSTEGMDVFVIGATNRPDLLDPALLRPGRFDKMLYLGVPETHAAQLDILKALTRKFNLHASLSLASIAAHCPLNYTGADFYALCADALLYALSSKVTELEKERAELNALSKHQHQPISPQFFISELKSNVDLQPVIQTEDFDLALKELVPSVHYSELAHYALIQNNWHNEI